MPDDTTLPILPPDAACDDIAHEVDMPDSLSPLETALITEIRRGNGLLCGEMRRFATGVEARDAHLAERLDTIASKNGSKTPLILILGLLVVVLFTQGILATHEGADPKEIAEAVRVAMMPVASTAAAPATYDPGNEEPEGQ